MLSIVKRVAMYHRISDELGRLGLGPGPSFDDKVSGQLFEDGVAECAGEKDSDSVKTHEENSKLDCISKSALCTSNGLQACLYTKKGYEVVITLTCRS